jgi:hypothetical protein
MKVQNNGNGAKTQSGYLQHLPGLYRDDELMGQFLFIFESIMEPLENTVSSLPMYFDPMVTPDSLLEWAGLLGGRGPRHNVGNRKAA